MMIPAVRSALPSKQPRNAKVERSRDPHESRRALVEAAAELFNTVGYNGTDSNRIARAAGYAPGTFYTHFPDKLAIFLEVYDVWVRAELEAIEQALSLKGGARSLRRRLAATILEHHRKWRVFRASLRALYALDARVHSARLAQRNRQIDVMARMQETRGGPIPTRARMLATLLLFEGICDAIADGDARTLGVRETDLLGTLVEAMEQTWG